MSERLQSFCNLWLKIINAAVALINILLLREVVSISLAADLIIAQVICTIAIQLVSTPIGQDLIRDSARENFGNENSGHLRLVLFRALFALGIAGSFGLLFARWVFPDREYLGMLLIVLSPTILTGSIALLFGHFYATKKSMLGFVLGQGFLTNLSACLYLGAVWFDVLPRGFSNQGYVGILLIVGTAVALGMLAHIWLSHIGRSFIRNTFRSVLPSKTVKSNFLLIATILSVLVQQMPALLMGGSPDPAFVVQFILVQRFATQFALISNSISIQFVPDMMAAFASAEPKVMASQVLHRFRQVNLTFGLAAIFGYAAICTLFLYEVTEPQLWNVTVYTLVCLFLPNMVTAICGFSGPTLVAARKDWILCLAFGVNLIIIFIGFLGREFTSSTFFIVIAFGVAQLVSTGAQYIYIRRRLGLDIVMGNRLQ